VYYLEGAERGRGTGPQVITHMIHSRKADMYAFGIVLWELMTWELPWEDMGTFQVWIKT
jgi:Protein tyrosine and serine/threonine kinase